MKLGTASCNSRTCEAEAGGSQFQASVRCKIYSTYSPTSHNHPHRNPNFRSAPEAQCHTSHLYPQPIYSICVRIGKHPAQGPGHSMVVLTSNRLQLHKGRGGRAAKHLVLSYSDMRIPAGPYLYHFPIVQAVTWGQRHLKPKRSIYDFQEKTETHASGGSEPTLWCLCPGTSFSLMGISTTPAEGKGTRTVMALRATHRLLLEPQKPGRAAGSCGLRSFLNGPSLLHFYSFCLFRTGH